MLKKLNTWLRITYFKSKTKSNCVKTQLNDEEIKIIGEISDKGVVVIPDFFTNEECSNITSQIDDFIIKHENQVRREENNSDNRLYGAEILSNEINDFHNNKMFQRLCESYLKVSCTNQYTLAARLDYKENNLGSGGGWHRDTPFKKQFKSIVYLSDVSGNNGPFEYILGTHKNESYFNFLNKGIDTSKYRFSEKELEKIEKAKDYQIQQFTAKKGTLILVDTSGIHRGMPIQEGNRYALTNYFIQNFLITEKSDARKNKLLVK